LLGYFITENLAIGGRFSYSTLKAEDGSGNVVEKNSALRVEAIARHYFLDLRKRFKTYTNYNIGFESGK